MNQSLIFGRDNTGYAVVATDPNKPNNPPVVVSIHLGEKLAHTHAVQMQSRSRTLQFDIMAIEIGSLQPLQVKKNQPNAVKHTPRLLNPVK